MNSDLSLLIGSIIGGAGAMLSYWAGWNARDRERQPRGSYGVPRRKPSFGEPPCGGGEITLAQWEAMRTPFTEGRTIRDNRNGGPGGAKPEIVPKPQFPPGRIIGSDGMTIGYRPIPSRPNPKPQYRRNPFISEFQQQINDALGIDDSYLNPNPPPRER